MKKKEENKQKLNNIAAIRQKFENIGKNVEVNQPKEESKVGKINQNPQLFKKETHVKQPPVKEEKTVGKVNTDWLTKGSEKAPVKQEPKVGKLNPQLQKNVLNIMQPPKKEPMQVGKVNPGLQKNILNIFQPPLKEQPKVGKLNMEALGGELNLFGDVNQLNKEQLEEIVQVDLKTNYVSSCFLTMDGSEAYKILDQNRAVTPEELFKVVQKHIGTFSEKTVREEGVSDQEMAVEAFTHSQVGFILMRGEYRGEKQERLCYIDWKSNICQEIRPDKVPNHQQAHEALKNKCKDYAEITHLPALTSNQRDIEHVNAVITEYLESAVEPAQEKLDELKRNELK